MARSRTTGEPPPAVQGERPITIKRLRTESQFVEETKGLERRERDKYDSMIWNLMRLDLAPKVQIMDLVGARLDQPIDTGHEHSLRTVVDHYHGRPDRAELSQVLKFFSVYLLQRARREPSFSKQLFLLFKAVDLLRMLTQYSTWCVQRDAEALVFVIFDALGAQRGETFAKYRDTEFRIFPLMKKLTEVPRDFVLRLELGDELVRQTSFFDALVQYDFLRRFYPRFYTEKNLDRKLGAIYTRQAALFQNMADHLGQDFRDARKLNSFIERYNRSFAGRGGALVPFTTEGRSTAQRVAQGLRQTAEHWYRRALAIKVLSPDLLIQNALGYARNLAGERRFKEATAVLMDGYRGWSGLGDDIQTLQRRVGYLDEMIKVAKTAGRKDRLDWASLEQRDRLAKLDELIRQNEAYKKRREAIVREANEGKEDREVPPFVAANRRGGAGARGRGSPAEPEK